MRKHKAIRIFMIVTVLLIQVILLTTILKSNYESHSMVAIASICLVVFTIFLGYRYLNLHHEDYDYEKLSVIIWVPIGAVLCYLLNVLGHLGSVLSAGIMGSMASFIPVLGKKSAYLKKLPAAIYCGAFVGMSRIEIIPNISFVIAAGILAGIFLMFSKNLFLGIGGKLGTIAFVGVVIASLIYSVTA